MARNTSIDRSPGHETEKLTTENFSEQDMKISCTQPEGFFVKVSMKAKINLAPQRIYDILTDPENHKIFKAIMPSSYRKTLYDDGNKQVVEVEQISKWRFLVFSGKFTTRLKVTQNRKLGTIRFDLVKSDLMKDFEGMWTIQPFTQASIDKMESGKDGGFGLRRFWSDLQSSFGGGPTESLVLLEQSVQPKSVPPGPLAGMLRKIAAKQVSIIMTDLKKEVARINSEKENDEEHENKQRRLQTASISGASLWDISIPLQIVKI
eukprot:TRINITY_DN8557_c0_g2_i3.p2 TRINITY_DN8557_c0_g2~~TRINITY_DN8557_c0_g2_i3.p2  ORF type:complete len:263 (-),score=35.71 TRINITY_DN8557_c0_g2_i3:1139-1927(-)